MTISEATSTTKPVYLTMGNHDYCIYEGDSYTKQTIFDTFIAPTNTHNGTNFTKTYYNIDQPNYMLKFIMLDLNDGWADEDLIGQGPTNLTYDSIMSSEQINWFINQLYNAADNGYGVSVFIHESPGAIIISNEFSKFVDTTHGNKRYRNFGFLLDIVLGFIDGTAGNVTHNGSTYSFDFTSHSKGIFVSWFCGHTHFDRIGYFENYPKQFNVNVPQPYVAYSSYGYDATSRYDTKQSIHWNYVTIDMSQRRLHILRVGDRMSKTGLQKDVISVFF